MRSQILAVLAAAVYFGMAAPIPSGSSTPELYQKRGWSITNPYATLKEYQKANETPEEKRARVMSGDYDSLEEYYNGVLGYDYYPEG